MEPEPYWKRYWKVLTTCNLEILREPTSRDRSVAPPAVNNSQWMQAILQYQSSGSNVFNGWSHRFHSLKIPFTAIVWVNTWSGLEDCVETISKVNEMFLCA